MFDKLEAFARYHALSYELRFDESEGFYSASMDGAGTGENFHSAKRCVSMEEAIKDLLAKAQRFYEHVNHN